MNIPVYAIMASSIPCSTMIYTGQYAYHPIKIGIYDHYYRLNYKKQDKKSAYSMSSTGSDTSSGVKSITPFSWAISSTSTLRFSMINF